MFGGGARLSCPSGTGCSGDCCGAPSGCVKPARSIVLGAAPLFVVPPAIVPGWAGPVVGLINIEASPCGSKGGVGADMAYSAISRLYVRTSTMKARR